MDRLNYEEARERLLALAEPVGTERVPLSESPGRVLAQPLAAEEDIPPFDRSPYDGYAFRSGDTQNASEQAPVTLRVLEELPAGAVPTRTVEAGTATKLLTGAPIPPGADVVCKFEDTRFTPERVTLFRPYAPGGNIVFAGEDVRRGAVLAPAGVPIDAGLAGTLAALGAAEPLVFRRPRIGVLSTGDELLEPGAPPAPGKIRNSSRYALEAALRREGLTPVFLGLAGDSAEAIAARLKAGLDDCDAVLTTGGVSVGDYDRTPAAMELAGVELLVRGLRMKPGMACAFGRRDGKLVLGLSGNPASALTSFYAAVLPALRRLAGRRDCRPAEVTVVLKNGFPKRSPQTRLLRGTLELTDGTARLRLPEEQGNVMLSSLIGCDAMAVVPGGSGPLAAGTVLKGFLL